MKKYLFVAFTLLFISTAATNTYAHSHLESSTPQNGQVVTEELNEITLTFNEKIEQGSTFELITAQDETIPVKNIDISEGVLTGTLASPLANDEYIVNWNIISADGHIMEGEFSFNVDVAVSETVETDEVQVTEVDTDENQTTVNESTEDETTQKESSSNLLIIVMVVLVVVIIGSSLLLVKRKK